jgi:hypothetical protein
MHDRDNVAIAGTNQCKVSYDGGIIVIQVSAELGVEGAQIVTVTVRAL